MTQKELKTEIAHIEKHGSVYFNSLPEGKQTIIINYLSDLLKKFLKKEVQMAKSIILNGGGACEAEDIEGQVNMAICLALKKYKVGKGTKLPSFCFFHVRKAIYELMDNTRYVIETKKGVYKISEFYKKRKKLKKGNMVKIVYPSDLNEDSELEFFEDGVMDLSDMIDEENKEQNFSFDGCIDNFSVDYEGKNGERKAVIKKCKK